jgi:hypothetical protein
MPIVWFRHQVVATARDELTCQHVYFSNLPRKQQAISLTIEEYGQASRTISTASLKPSRVLHSRPIKRVVCPCPLGPLRGGKPNLEAGFTLRCFQRLSLPNSATQRYPWRDNWHTGGLFNQVLSYYGQLLSSFLTRMVDRDRTVSRRTEPSSRTALMGEQPNPSHLLQREDAMSRHRGAKPGRRCELLDQISLLSPG